MIAFLYLLSLGWADDKLIRPVMGQDGVNDCAQAIPVRAGQPFPSLATGANGQAKCSGVLLPPAQLAYLLKLEEYVEAVERMHMLDIDLLKQERNVLKNQLAIANEPIPWHERPSTQRWVGRIETLVAVGLAASMIKLSYNQSRGE